MRLSLKAKQVAGVTLIVGLAATALSIIHLAYITRIGLFESQARGDLLANAIYQQARTVVTSPEQAHTALQRDPGIRSILESGIGYSRNVTYAAIVDTRNIAIAHSSPTIEGQVIEPQATLMALLQRNLFAQLRAVFSDRTFEVQQPLLLGDEQFGSIRIGLSTILVREDLKDALTPAVISAAIALVVSMFAAMLLAQWMLRPILVLKSGLSRLQQGEFGVTLDLPPGHEFAELGSSFNTMSAELAVVRTRLAGQSAQFESLVDRLEDAVAMFNREGELVFGNAAMRSLLPDAAPGRPLRELAEADHPLRRLVERAVATQASQGPLSVAGGGEEARSGDMWVMAHAIQDVDRRIMGVMLVARNVGYLSQVQSTVQYSRKLAALGRLLAGVAHEVKNPLNAMTIHLELLKQKLRSGVERTRLRSGAVPVAVATEAGSARGTDSVFGLSRPPAGGGPPDKVTVEVPSVLKHVAVIGEEIRRLDEVVQGFLKFSRPQELSLETISLHSLVDDVISTVDIQAREGNITILNECPPGLAPVGGDRAMLRQALLNLALNACQAMPEGGTLRFTAEALDGRRVALLVEDTGVGIAPEHLQRVFDLYFTTKEGGSGIGLSMVFRTVQLHDGHIEVQSTMGRGTSFRILLPQDRRREPRPQAG